ncbi:MAG: hypothetical protein AAGI36_11060 [Pseudomonadota bacterium]
MVQRYVLGDELVADFGIRIWKQVEFQRECAGLGAEPMACAKVVLRYAVLFLVVCWSCVCAYAESDRDALGLGGNIILRFGYNGVYDANQPLLETNDILALMIASPEFRFSKQFSVKSEIRYEDIVPPDRDRFFEDEGLFVRKLFGVLEATDNLTFNFGKITPSFTLASLVTPGMYGNNYNKEIELIERVGVQADYSWDAGIAGKYTLSASTFFDDTTIFSESFGSNRGRNSLSDGGASNTEALDSFAFALEGREIRELPGLNFKIGLLYQERGFDGVADERGFLIGATRNWDLDNERSFSWIAEVAPIWNFEGTEDDIVYTSGGLVYGFDKWTAVVSGTYRRRSLAVGGTYNDYSLQTSIDYDLGGGFSVALAHEFLRNENVRSRRIGFRLSKIIDLNG